MGIGRILLVVLSIAEVVLWFWADYYERTGNVRKKVKAMLTLSGNSFLTGIAAFVALICL